MISPIAGANGSPVQLVSVGRDITALKQAEQRLSQSEERLNMALGAAGNIGIWDWDLTTDLIYTDKAIAHFFSLDENAAIAGVPITAPTPQRHARNPRRRTHARARPRLEGLVQPADRGRC